MNRDIFSYEVSGIQFALAEKRDMSFLEEFGVVQCVFDQNDSGNISFGVEKDGRKYFLKIAGLRTKSTATSPAQARDNLKHAAELYEKIKHPNLVPLMEAFDKEDMFIAVFPWKDGECLFDHWNFEKYKQNGIKSPFERFWQLGLDKKLRVMDVLFSFFSAVHEAGFLATDFYDGSLMYRFQSDEVILCDIDFFRKLPSINETGFIWGSDRFKAPEEKIRGAVLNAATDVYHLGVFAFLFFGKSLINCQLSDWTLSERRYWAARRATLPSAQLRYQTISEFWEHWKE